MKNPNKAGKPNTWVLNGQGFYSGTLNWRLRKSIAQYYHEYFTVYILDQLDAIILKKGEYLSISCDIYDLDKNINVDCDNMWPLEKFFTDSLVACAIIPDDSPKYVRENGRKRYHFVESEEDRKLIFTIKLI